MSESNPYDRVKGGRLAFKGGVLATRSQSIDKKKKNKQKKKNKNKADSVESTEDNNNNININDDDAGVVVAGDGVGEVVYTIDAAKRMKYEQLFPVEAKKFGYDPINIQSTSKSVEQALDDRVKKKADRYCK